MNMKTVFCLPIKGRIYSIDKEDEKLRGRNGSTLSNKVLSFWQKKGKINALEVVFFFLWHTRVQQYAQRQ